MSGNSIEPSIETENVNASKSNIDSISNNNNYLSPRTPSNVNKSEIINILNNNLNYFNQKRNEEKKFVLNTIRIPKTLGKLNDKLPESQYESDNIRKRKNSQGLSFPNKILPVLKVRYNSNDKNINSDQENKFNDIEENKNIMNLNNNRKLIELNPPTLLNVKNIKKNKRAINDENIFLKNNNVNVNKYYQKSNRYDGYNKFNTLKMMIDKNKPFNYRGQIDIIVEE